MDYPNQRLLVTVDWLRDHLDDESVVVLDVRAGQSLLTYRADHLPGARPFSLPHTQALVGSAPDCLDCEALAEQLGALGVRPEQTVVLYDERYSPVLARSFWACEVVGQREVRVLEGGLAAWRAAGGITTAALPHWEPCPYATPPREQHLATAEWIVQHDAQVLDARTAQEWRAARIAGAVNCCWSAFVQDLEGSTLLPAEAIQAKLAALGLSPARETVTYCRSGVRATFIYFVLRLLGWESVRTYDGSMTDWLLQGRSVAKG